MKDTDAKPQWLTDKALKCAIAACADSQWWSDRAFAKACGAELERRAFLSTKGPSVPTGPYWYVLQHRP